MTRSRSANNSARNQRAAENRPAKQQAKPLKRPPSARGRQIVRQLSILRILEAKRRGLTIAELHQIIARTVYRDIEQLLQAGFRLVDVEKSGRWSVHGDGASIRSWPVHQSEVLSLLLSEDLLSPETGGAFG